MRSRIGIDVDAPPVVVFELVRDVERWSRLLPHYVRSRVRERHDDGSVTADFIARRPIVRSLGLGLPVAWRSRVWADPTACRLRFHHVAGATRGMDVIWSIEPRPMGGSRVEIDHDFAPPIPGFAGFVDRGFTRPIAGRTLATVRDLAEALAATRTTVGS
jgi:ribosome-associated toxin RatA of RatAB toxin-antitoxin module